MNQKEQRLEALKLARTKKKRTKEDAPSYESLVIKPDREMYDAAVAGASSPGRNALLLYWQTGKTTLGVARKAQCYLCMGYYFDGKIDCQMEICPLFPHRPYKGKFLKITYE